MSRIHPIQVLLDEHTLIEHVLDTLESALKSLGSDPAAATRAERAFDFLVHFGDGIHQEKEETVLFPLLRRKGLNGAARALVDEHRTGHRRLHAIAQNLSAAVQGDDQALAFIRAQGLAYVALMRDHIREEDETLFHVARQVLTAEDIEELDRLFAEQGRNMDEAAFQKYLSLGEELAGAA